MIGAGGEIISDVIRQTRGRREMWPVACGLWRRQTTQAGCVCAYVRVVAPSEASERFR
jgi:hypothetical protein